MLTLFKKSISISFIFLLGTSLSGCYMQMSNQNYVGQSVVITKPEAGIKYIFSASLIEINNGVAKFKINGHSQQSNPLVKLMLSQAKLVSGTTSSSCVECENTTLIGIVNPRNGQTQFEDVELEFKAPNLKIGKLSAGENKTIIQNFNITVPAQIPLTPAQERDSGKSSRKNSYLYGYATNVENKDLIFSFKAEIRADGDNFLRGVYSAY